MNLLKGLNEPYVAVISKFYIIFIFQKTDVNTLILKLDIDKFHVMNYYLNDNS